MSLLQSTTSFNVPKFPCFGVIEATHPKDEKILSFDYETLEIKQWRKEKVEKKLIPTFKNEVISCFYRIKSYLLI